MTGQQFLLKVSEHIAPVYESLVPLELDKVVCSGDRIGCFIRVSALHHSTERLEAFR